MFNVRKNRLCRTLCFEEKRHSTVKPGPDSSCETQEEEYHERILGYA